MGCFVYVLESDSNEIDWNIQSVSNGVIWIFVAYKIETIYVKSIFHHVIVDSGVVEFEVFVS